MNIYVGNLPYTVSEDEVRQAFTVYGQVSSVALIKDRDTGQMRGFGFVEMPDEDEAQLAIQNLNGKEFKNRRLVVNPARPRQSHDERDSGGYDRERRSTGEYSRRPASDRRRQGGNKW
jgi:RNA recognition motif-containing protein